MKKLSTAFGGESITTQRAIHVTGRSHKLLRRPQPWVRIGRGSYIDKGVTLHGGVYIGEGVTIFEGAKIGEWCIIDSHAVLRQGAKVAPGTVINRGAVLYGGRFIWKATPPDATFGQDPGQRIALIALGKVAFGFQDVSIDRLKKNWDRWVKRYRFSPAQARVALQFLRWLEKWQKIGIEKI